MTVACIRFTRTFNFLIQVSFSQKAPLDELIEYGELYACLGRLNCYHLSFA